MKFGRLDEFFDFLEKKSLNLFLLLQNKICDVFRVFCGLLASFFTDIMRKCKDFWSFKSLFEVYIVIFDRF